uniref:C2H2-type domain-containing protein n=1 Tax=Knipowitschia caucasica TaxID=637954 RepID=A0AAV2MBH8_KNICA
MPRRKQQEPRRSAAYMPEDELKAAPHEEEEHLQDDGLSLDGQDTEFMCNDEDDDLDGGQLPSYRDSPLSNGTNPDAGYGSPLSDSSDRLADFKSTSSRDGQERDANALRPNGNKSSGTSIVSSQHNGKGLGSAVNHTSNSTCTTNGVAVSTASTHSATSSSGNSGAAASNGTGVAYDWHQAALAKTLQQTPYHLLPEPSLFSTVQLYRQNNKLYGSVFTGASKFRCKDCSAAYDTLVGLTVHMNETGHYRDDNKDKEEEQGKRWSKPRKRSLMEMEGKEDAQKSIMNTHLGKAPKPVSPAVDPLSMLYKISNSMIDKPAFTSNSQGKSAEPISHYQIYDNTDQPIDLMSSPLRENALMDISDMVKNLTGRLTPKSSTPSSISEKSDAEGSAFEDAMEDLSPVQKRKGRQSNWNPQHLLILQAQFASSLRETSEGRYAMTDLGPQERVHICKFTGLSMTTISHWLANVKYQLRRTGGTKFLKNMDSCQPVFLCGDCASQFRTPASYINHLESHLGFSLKDLSKLSSDHLREQQAASKVITDKLTFSTPLSMSTAEEEAGSVYQCRLCNRTFVSKHAVKLHLSKTHGKSPEDHLVFVTALEKLEKLGKMEKVQV